MNVIVLTIFKMGPTVVMASYSPNFSANYFDVSFNKSKLPKTVPKAFATVEIMLTKCGVLSSFKAKQSKEISCKLIKNIEPIRIRAKK